jgi:hypothetical protein
VSYQAYLPSLIERENLLTGNSRLALTESIAGIAGPGIAGTLVHLITAPLALLFDAASFVCSTISVWLIRKREPAPPRTLEAHIGREISEGPARRGAIPCSAHWPAAKPPARSS